MGRKELKNHLIENQGYLKWAASKIADKFGDETVDEETVSEIRKEIRQNFDNENRSTSDQNQYSTTSEDIPEGARGEYLKHLEDLGIEEEDVDSVKYWQTFFGEHRFSVVTKSDDPEEPGEDEMLQVIEEHLADYEMPDAIPQKMEPKGDNLGVINLYDAHLDKVSLAAETTEEIDGSIQENIQNFESAFDEFLHTLVDNGVRHVHFPLGHDLWEVNDHYLLTKNGTPQRVNVPWQQGFSVGLDMVRRCIDKAAQVVDSIDVILIPGNHDEDQNFYLGEVLRHIYQSSDRVNVGYSRRKRKYRLFGDVLLGYSHGENTTSQKKIERLPLNMAHEAAEKWAQATVRMMLLGHIHRKLQHKILHNLDAIGCEIKFLRSVGTENKYEFDNGYTGIPKTAELYVFSEDGRKRWNAQKVWW